MTMDNLSNGQHVSDGQGVQWKMCRARNNRASHYIGIVMNMDSIVMATRKTTLWRDRFVSSSYIDYGGQALVLLGNII